MGGYSKKRIAALSRWGKIDAIKKESRIRAAAGDRSKDVMRFARVRGDSAKMKTALFETNASEFFVEHLKMLQNRETSMENDEDLENFAKEFDESDSEFDEFDSDEIPTRTPLEPSQRSLVRQGGWDAEDSPMIIPSGSSLNVHSMESVKRTKRKVLIYTYEETDV